ncbi:MAG: hypothetical protein ACREIP_11855, partial [Alphaproteobacteria bacterium]
MPPMRAAVMLGAIAVVPASAAPPGALAQRAPADTPEFALNFPEDMRYAVYWLERAEGSVYVALTVAENKFNQWPETFGKTMVPMDVVEVGQMERRMTDPKADEMKQRLDK